MRAVLILLVVCTAFAQGCINRSVYRETGPDFPGISKRMSPSRPLKILVVHGAGTHNEQYADILLQKISDRVGLQRQRCRVELNPIRHPDPKGVNYGSVNRCDYHGRQGQRVSFYILTWSPLTTVIKGKYLGYDWMDKQLTDDRLSVNAELKEHLIDKRLSDLVLYVGRFREQMQYSVQQAICLMMQEHEVQDNVCTLPKSFLGETDIEQFMVIASDLGSTMVFQTVEALHKQTHELTPAAMKDQFARAAEKFAADTTTIFMLANPLPLLRLGDLQAPVASELHPSVETFIMLRHEERRRRQAPIRESLQVVVFNDPNDPLSFPIPESFVDELPQALQDKVLFTNVMLTTADVGMFKHLADPVAAHTSYAINPVIIKLMSCGTRTQVTC